MTCQSCKHWFRPNAEAERGVCRRYPPAAGGVVMSQGIGGPQPVVVWACPETVSHYTCGEFRSFEPTVLVS